MCRRAGPALVRCTRDDDGPLRVLLVDSNAIVAMDLADVMESLGYEVVGPVASCAAARQLLKSVGPDGSPHSALIDFHPHDGDADGLARSLRAAGVPFAWVNAGRPEDLPAGPEPALDKPCPLPALGATIGMLVACSTDC